eukprot:COSAG06_NODE_14710_length_1130_cov_7.140368_2_plen_53_part_01
MRLSKACRGKRAVSDEKESMGGGGGGGGGVAFWGGGGFVCFLLCASPASAESD